MAEQEKTKGGKFMLLGMFLGLAFGTIFGAATDRVGLWLPVGLGVGASFGLLADVVKERKEKPG